MLSLWRDNVCAGSFRLAVDEVPDLIEMLRAGLVRSYEDARARLEAVESAVRRRCNAGLASPYPWQGRPAITPRYSERRGVYGIR